MHNLISNAVKYAPNDSVINVAYYINEDKMLKVTVEDYGKGISKEDQKRIFERYYRVNDNISASIAGFGIGLYLSKEIVELHQGTIEVQSSPEKSTVFSFTLPLIGQDG